MKKWIRVVAACYFMLIIGLAGCSKAPKTGSATEAIQQAQQLNTMQEKAQYLINEANAFLQSHKFDEAVNTAKYVLSELDRNSQQAKSILEKAMAELKKASEEKMNQMKKGMGNT
ncbi:MAG: hypothetical protein ABH836_07225 [Candidatus Omnitrophota bacterium]